MSRINVYTVGQKGTLRNVPTEQVRQAAVSHREFLCYAPKRGDIIGMVEGEGKIDFGLLRTGFRHEMPSVLPEVERLKDSVVKAFPGEKERDGGTETVFLPGKKLAQEIISQCAGRKLQRYLVLGGRPDGEGEAEIGLWHTMRHEVNWDLEFLGRRRVSLSDLAGERRGLVSLLTRKGIIDSKGFVVGMPVLSSLQGAAEAMSLASKKIKAVLPEKEPATAERVAKMLMEAPIDRDSPWPIHWLSGLSGLEEIAWSGTDFDLVQVVPLRRAQ